MCVGLSAKVVRISDGTAVVDAGNYLFKVGSDVENIKGTATLKVAEYTEKTSNACAPKVQLNYLKQK